MTHPLAGVYAAAPTPLKTDFTPDLESIPRLLDFLARRGCHGALLLGTTGEGPSFSPAERSDILRAALEVRQAHPDFRLLAGTGTPSLTETVELTRTAFDLGFNGVVTLPPYYFRQADEDGLFAWFREVIRRGVPGDGHFLGYHIPAQSGVPLSLDLLARLKDAFPAQFAGIKDSSGDPQNAAALGEHFGDDLLVLTGNDSLLTYALERHAQGCITALSNLTSPDARAVWDAFRRGGRDPEAQARLDAYRTVLAQYPPYAVPVKVLLAAEHNFPLWTVRPPLLPMPEARVESLVQAWRGG